MTKLRLTLVQCNLYWENPKKNINHIAALLSEVEETDIIILPEFFSTAFSVTAMAKL